MEERRGILKSYILEHSRATVEQLNALFPDTSSMTIRRDLDVLEQSGSIIRIHGGAMANPAFGLDEELYGIREVENSEAKRHIAHIAVSLAADLRSIYIDAGTTAMEFARQLPDCDLLVTTPGANIGMELAARNTRMAVTLLGGNISRKSFAASGSISMRQLESINIDTAFMCTSGFAPQSGFTNGNAQESELKRFVMSKARRVIMMVDSSKFGKTLPYTFAKPENIDLLITEREPEGEIAAQFQKVKLIYKI